MRVIFFGTPEFAVPTFEALLKSRHEVAAVVTQPDRPKGRALRSAPSPVKTSARKAGIPVLQPEGMGGDLIRELSHFSADIAVVVAYGSLLPQKLLSLFPKGAINLHPSLLPQYRGAAPIQWALINGERETGVTVFQLDAQMDHGPILLQEAHPIEKDDTAAILAQKLSGAGARTMLKTLDLIENKKVKPIPQEDSKATVARRLTKEDGKIDWSENCEHIRNRVRGMQPWPCAYTSHQGKRLKILSAAADPARPEKKPAGTVISASAAEGLWVQTGRGGLRIDRLQLEGGKALDAASFLRGHPIPPATQFS